LVFISDHVKLDALRQGKLHSVIDRIRGPPRQLLIRSGGQCVTEEGLKYIELTDELLAPLGLCDEFIRTSS
jgi:hypothetical protein